MVFYIHCIQLEEIVVAKKLHYFSANKINEAKTKVTVRNMFLFKLIYEFVLNRSLITFA